MLYRPQTTAIGHSSETAAERKNQHVQYQQVYSWYNQ